jgi:hypothetical protein
MKKIIYLLSALVVIGGLAGAYLASTASPLLLPLYRYDAHHDMVPDFIWNNDLPYHSRYRGQLLKTKR